MKLKLQCTCGNIFHSTSTTSLASSFVECPACGEEKDFLDLKVVEGHQTVDVFDPDDFDEDCRELDFDD